ncbi:hypothetical protein ACMU_01720 [Actibacterium mucosum KCTC 23349]|uniref:Smr domain-containing protein n=1 Tax=Actibacterium mucosum KCTC 23349 TaxID=1454373 RepID=A0A037ZNV6_9RHOB|nr:Smr/MutS family protein [Actibacterium mucosum]KAJ57238.1 hypothetical protein ACMU_01720 [Actibacterium mucosum KCTC 23349]
MARRRRGQLSDEDKTLWKKVTDTATPLSKPGPVITTPKEKVPAPKPSQRMPKPAPVVLRPPATPAPKPSTAISRAPDIAEHLRSAPVKMDRNRYGKLTRGKLSPEARIDLHGMTLAQAHPALNGFILNAAAQGKRLVLVITGKGVAAEHPWPDFERRGVLRQQVPHWLHSAPLAAHVLQVTPAHVKHGGTGAYYVYLKRGR